MIDFTADSGRTYRYAEEDQIGESGTFGTVYRAMGTDGSIVAAKIVNVRAGSVEDRTLAEREVVVWSQLPEQPGGHVVPLLDVARTTSGLILVMPLASRNLADLIAVSAPLATAEAAEIVRQLAMGMQELAAAGVVHRDIKPLNILEIDGRWMLADFGISRLIAAATAAQTFKGVGTLEYRAPELFSFEPERVASDLYALGCVAYELVTGQKAFPGPDFKTQHLTSVPALPPSVVAPLRTMILDLLAKEPASRPPDARHVVHMLTSRTTLPEWQRGVLRMQAATAERRIMQDARINTVMQFDNQQSEARTALKYLWRSTVEMLTQFDPTAESGEALPHSDPYFIVGDFRFLLKIDEAQESLTELLYVGTLIAMREGDSRPEVGIVPANLVCVWKDNAPRWIVVRFVTTGTIMSRMQGIGASSDMLSYDGENFHAYPGSQIVKEVATPDLILQLFNEAVEARQAE